ncbi:ladderlectin-like [Scomber scombrus]|uniref:ladderlectin-like n=1 Tax=Scomber scombrus TaxID=13677 RepID=UPI002DD7DA15|nr:ladderlectin-like [Scomber scombrus]
MYTEVDVNYTTTTPYTTPYTTTSTPQTVTCCLTTLTTATTTTTPSQSQMMCPEGWSVFQGRCYYFMSGSYTWPQAQSACAMQDSMLVSVHSAQEYGFLQQLTTSNGYEYAWLGGFYLQGDWLWLDGSWFYNFTWTVQTDPYSSYPCLMLSSTQEWSNSQCDISSYPAICEKSSNVQALLQQKYTVETLQFREI